MTRSQSQLVLVGLSLLVEIESTCYCFCESWCHLVLHVIFILALGGKISKGSIVATLEVWRRWSAVPPSPYDGFYHTQH